MFEGNRRFAVFRHELFKHSETFITEQADAIPGWSPFYVGRSRASSGGARGSYASWEHGALARSRASQIIQVALRTHGCYERAIRESGAELVHAHFGVEGVYALPLARKMALPLVTTFHGFDATTTRLSLLRSGKPSWINYLLFRGGLAKKAEMFLCVSDHIRSRVVEMGFPRERCITHYIGVDVHRFDFRKSESQEKPYILHVGRLVEKKGCADLINAFSILRSDFPDVDLKIAGTGPLLGILKQLVAKLGLERRVSFLGAVEHEEVRRLMRDALLICQPSVTAPSGDTEGLPVVLMEAAAVGLPIVSTFHAGIPELVAPGVGGILVPEREVVALSSAIGQMLSSRQERLNFALNARRAVESKFDVRKQSELLSRFYESLT